MSFSDVSAVTNHFVTANEGFTTTTSGPVSSGATEVGLASVAGLTNGSIFVGVIEPSGEKEQVFTGTVDTGGARITDVKWTRGTNVAHSTGVSIVDYDTGTGFNMMRKGILVSLDQDGSLKTGAVDVPGVLASNVVTTAKIADDAVTTAKILNAAVTPAKRTGGFYVGSFSITNGVTGAKAITGVGFTPKLVTFMCLTGNSQTLNEVTQGAMDSSGNQWASGAHNDQGGDNSGNSSTSHCILSYTTDRSTVHSATYTSMDSDGFTINVTASAATRSYGFIAQA